MIDTLCTAIGIAPTQLFAPPRTGPRRRAYEPRRVARARQVAYYVRRAQGRTYGEIAREFGVCRHTALGGAERIRNRLLTDAVLAELVAELLA